MGKAEPSYVSRLLDENLYLGGGNEKEALIRENAASIFGGMD
jgi:hypothetical protein